MITPIKKSAVLALILIHLGLNILVHAENRIIESVSVFGNYRISTTSIKRIIKLHLGQSFELEMLQTGRERLERLGIFKHVTVESKNGDQGIIVIVTVKEKPLFFIAPIINLGGSASFYEEEEKSYFGAEFGIHDFTGRGHHLSLEGGFGGLKKIGAHYTNEYFADFSWGLSLENLWYKSKIYDSDVEKLVGSAFVNKYIVDFGAHLWARYDRFRFSPLTPPTAQTRLYKLGINLTYNTKDWDIYPSRGISSLLGAYKTLSQNRRTLYNRYLFEFSSYFQVMRQQVLALGLNTAISKGEVPVTDRLYFGGFKTLRGIPIGTYSGNNSMVLSGEYRIPLTRFDKHQSAVGPQGLVAYLFLDVGSITEKTADISRKSFRANSGVGIFWIAYPEGGLRIDISVQPDFRFTLNSIWKF